MIYTLTLNTAVDMNICCDDILPARVNRTRSTEYCPNGKGVNVARVLHHFHQPVHIQGIFGGFTGNYIVDALREDNLKVTPTWVDGPTRINIFINDGRQEYKLVNPGSPVNADCRQQVIGHLQQLEAGDYLVISGSLPPGIDGEFYHDILRVCAQRGGEVILDISHPALRQLVARRPLLIKPNDEELAAVFGLGSGSHQQVRQSMAALHRAGARNVLLTLGARGLYFSSGTAIWFCNAPEVELVSSACAGDAALGAFLSRWLTGGRIDEALMLASATGADVAASAGLGQLSRITQLLTQVRAVQL